MIQKNMYFKGEEGNERENGTKRKEKKKIKKGRKRGGRGRTLLKYIMGLTREKAHKKYNHHVSGVDNEPKCSISRCERKRKKSVISFSSSLSYYFLPLNSTARCLS